MSERYGSSNNKGGWIDELDERRQRLFVGGAQENPAAEAGGVLRTQPGVQLSSAHNSHVLSGFTFLWCRSWLSPPLLDNPLFEQDEDDRSGVFIKQPNDVCNSHVAVEEEVADHEGSFGL